jgi:hypothetical protein
VQKNKKELKRLLEEEYAWDNLYTESNKWFIDELLGDFLDILKKQLPINGVVKSFTAKDDRNYQNWLIDECVKTSEGNYIYKLAEYTEEEIWQKWYYNNL